MELGYITGIKNEKGKINLSEMKLYIKNMVCSRCKMVVKNELEKKGFKLGNIELGEVEINDNPGKEKLKHLDDSLRKLGFELIDSRKSRIIEKIKNIVVNQVHYSEDDNRSNLSDLLVKELNYDYSYLSNLFSEVEGTTIEKYFISQRIEKVKELLIYDELTLSEIAFKMGYSSVAYLSNQFKKQTGLTPSFFKNMKKRKRNNIEDL
jgi:AraC-like DNA-binding protein